eukprot:TRINITY_DN28371_c0_g1_i2.p1 TRINITY_DN28371_c0_g1~~TRINITY_DN28371_c0_g1_i2.p1  ORF type:complete len:346 (-),score=65.91 TRINITY_DN28371_c0_g1_i2:191-1228(-)
MCIRDRVMLALLCCENAASMLARRYAVGVLRISFSKNTVLCVNELMKLVFSLYMTLYHPPETAVEEETPKAPTSGFSHIKLVLSRGGKMAVPAAVYLVVNLISYPALARIDASTFTAISQLKILSTALMSVVFLNTSVSLRKWRTLLSMVCGVVIVSVGSAPASAAHEDVAFADYCFGIFCAAAQTVLSGFAAVYFEKVLKSQQQGENFNVWDRNIQLAVISISIYLPMGIYETQMNLFAGFAPIVWFICFLHAAGGILVALSVLYSDSIAKTVAVCGGLVLTTVIGHQLFDAPLDLNIMSGCMLTVLAIVGYKDDCEVDKAIERLEYLETNQKLDENLDRQRLV